MKFVLGLEYSGINYFGFQKQANLPTIQFALEESLSKVANSKIDIYCAGRTDKGVHATKQIVHFETNIIRSDKEWVFGVNHFLPKDIVVLWVKEVDESFHARFQAFYRRYRYVIYNYERPNALLNGFLLWFCKYNLDVVRMNEAAQVLLGTHDFTSFRASGCQSKSPIKTIHMINVQRIKRMIIIDIQADAFLYHMVRNIVGVLLEIGSFRKDISYMNNLLLLKDRKKASVTVSPNGLYLVDVGYPEKYQIPQHHLGPYFI